MHHSVAIFVFCVGIIASAQTFMGSYNLLHNPELQAAASAVPTYQTPSTADATDTQSNTADSTGSTSSTPANKAVFLCLPDSIAANETALVFWSCNDTSREAEGDGFETDGATYGSARVNLSETSDLTLTCSSGAITGCQVTTVEPLLALIASSSGPVAKGSTVTLSWRGTAVTDCILTSDQHSTFERTGVEGDVHSPALYSDTTFELLCETEIGTLKRKSITIDVN